MPTHTLKKFFGYDNFRAGQIEIVNSILSQRDTLAILATGGGKSICFQIPGLIFPGTTLVISPLISLMKDQVDTLINKSIAATYINSSLSRSEINQRFATLAAGQYKFVYLAPERLTTKAFLKAIQNIQIPFIAIDEAHCTSMWGHDFRPSYQKIAKFVANLPQRPTVAAFTATATALVVKDMTKMLELKNARLFLNSFQRTNLYLSIHHCYSQFHKNLTLFKILRQHPKEAGIIYTATRKKAEYLAKLINHLNFQQQFPKTYFYHGGMSTEERSSIQEQFLSNKIQLIVATNAFGMGVDKSNIRYVIHYQIPGNIENYYQEAGRAGRDRQPAKCYFLFYPPDVKIQLQFIQGREEPKQKIVDKAWQSEKTQRAQRQNIKINKLKAMIDLARKKSCHMQKILQYFGETDTSNCNNCNHCSPLTKRGEKTRQLLNSRLEKILNIRKKISLLQKIPSSQIMTKKVACLLATLEPQQQNDFLKIPGIGQGWMEKWYQYFAEV